MKKIEPKPYGKLIHIESGEVEGLYGESLKYEVVKDERRRIFVKAVVQGKEVYSFLPEEVFLHLECYLEGEVIALYRNV